MNDRITVNTRISWGSRLGSSLKAIGTGLLLFVIAFPLLWWNEGRAVVTAKALQEGAGVVITVPPTPLDPANEGRLIHTSGRLAVDDTLQDPDFPQVQAKALMLRRHVEMFQWRERQETREVRNVGGSIERETTYTYVQEWSPTLIDSSRFQQPEGHRNPQVMPYAALTLTADRATLGAFTVPSDLLRNLQHTEIPLRVPEAVPTVATTPAVPPVPEGGHTAETLTLVPLEGTPAVPGAPPPNVQSNVPRVVQGGFYLGRSPEGPAIGDLRIRYTQVPEQEASVVARQAGTGFAGHRSADGARTLLMLQAGVQPAEAMFAAAASANRTLTWVLRLLGLLLMVGGLRLVLGPLGVLADVLPFLGTLVRLGTGLVAGVIGSASALLVIALAWLFYRPLWGIALLVLAAALLVGLALLARRRGAPGATAAT